jgi:hypothetical protein
MSRNKTEFLAFLHKICYTVANQPKGRTDMTASPILTAAQMTACDRYTIEILGIPSRTLMERAAAKAARFLLSRPDLFLEGPVLVLCGAGNNGGDGFAMARFLTDGSLGQRRETRILYLGRRLANGEPDPCSMS